MPRKTTTEPTRLNAKIQAELAGNEQAVVRAAVKEAFERVDVLLGAYFHDFSPKQQNKILATLGAAAAPGAAAPAKQPRQPRAPKPPKEELPPRFWLPFNGETWSGFGRPPKAFIAWEGTVAHAEWKKTHPDERFPKYPG